MKVLFFLGHPAHYHFFKNQINYFKKHNHEIKIVIKSKDVLEELLILDDIRYHNILPESRGNTKIQIIFSVIKRIIRLGKLIRKNRVELLIGT